MLEGYLPRTKISRRDFVRQFVALGFSLTSIGTLLSLLGCETEKTTLPTSAPEPSRESNTTPPVTPPSPPSQTPSTTTPSVIPSFPPSGAYLAVARGEKPQEIVNTAIKALGGMERFIKEGDNVIIKPNICVAYHSYEFAVTTNPIVVGTLVTLCLQAGAKRVRVMDYPFGGTPEQAYTRTGIGEAVENAGGEMEVMSGIKFREIPIPEGRDITSWRVYGDVIDADVLINVPIAKHHSIARLTLGMKNLMGLIQNRNQFHFNLGQRIADLTSLLRPSLTIVDAVRILTNHGPTGGSLDDVKLTNTIIASHDVVATDAHAATLFGLTGADIPVVRAAAQMGLGTMELNNIKIEEISV